MASNSFFVRPLKHLPSAAEAMRGRTFEPPPAGEVSVVIRHVGERTLPACASLLQEALPGAPMRLVSAVPFDACLRKAYDASLEMGTPWSLHVDADMLCLAEPLYRFFGYAREQKKNTFAFSALAMDRFFGLPRAAGLHLYRTAYLKKAATLYAEPGTTLRPETSVKRRIAEYGFPTIQTDIVLALHDYEQFYKHIFRKISLILHKFGHSHQLIPVWDSLAANKDYAVAGMAARNTPPRETLLHADLLEAWCETHLELPVEKGILDQYAFTQGSLAVFFVSEMENARHDLQSALFPNLNGQWTNQMGPVYPSFIEKLKCMCSQLSGPK
jgi:hypothetical protein